MISPDQRNNAQAAVKRLVLHDGDAFTPDPSEASLFELRFRGPARILRPKMGRGEQWSERMTGMELTFVLRPGGHDVRFADCYRRLTWMPTTEDGWLVLRFVTPDGETWYA